MRRSNFEPTMETVPTDEQPYNLKGRCSAFRADAIKCRIAASADTVEGSRRRFLILFVPLLLALPQISSASLVVLSLTQDKIIIAADSRIGQFGDYVDTECKVAALQGDVLYSAANLTGIRAEFLGGFTPGWSARDIAADALHGVADIPLEAVAEAWATTIEDNLRWSFFLQFALTLTGIDPVAGEAILGIFVRGRVLEEFRGLMVTVKCVNFPFCLAFDHKITPIAPGATLYGSRVAGRWVASRDWRGINITNAVDVGSIIGATINAHVAEDVGGAVDILELERGRRPTWVTRKPYCPN
jgi:hypothetical protein